MRTTILMLLYLLPLVLAAQEQKNSFSLEEAITYALEHNYQSINASRDMVDAQKQKWETIADGLPQISGAVSYQNQIIQQLSQIPSDFIPGAEPGGFVELAFGQPQTAIASATLTFFGLQQE